jgi:hypothetical protein
MGRLKMSSLFLYRKWRSTSHWMSTRDLSGEHKAHQIILENKTKLLFLFPFFVLGNLTLVKANCIINLNVKSMCTIFLIVSKQHIHVQVLRCNLFHFIRLDVKINFVTWMYNVQEIFSDYFTDKNSNNELPSSIHIYSMSKHPELVNVDQSTLIFIGSTKLCDRWQRKKRKKTLFLFFLSAEQRSLIYL